MINELKVLNRLRPPVQPPNPKARQAALEQLQNVIGHAPESHQPPEQPLSTKAKPGRRTGETPRSRVRGSGHSGERAGAHSRWSRRLPDVALIASTITALLIAGGAIVLLGHARSHPGGPSGRSGVRGGIVDRNGKVLVTSRWSIDVRIDLTALPASSSARDAEFRGLARMLNVSSSPRFCKLPHVVARLAAIPCAVAQQQSQGSSASVTVAHDVPTRVAREIASQPAMFAGVVARRMLVRSYPFGGLAAQTLGTVGPINAAESRNQAYAGTSPNAVVGQSGLEAFYNSDLRAGSTLRLSLQASLQAAGQRALQHAIAANRPATGGAFVAMNPQNGDIYAIGSLPTFNPSIFTKPVSPAAYRRLVKTASGYPLLNRAIASAGPTGSTFKPITATAALESGKWTVGSIYNDTGSFQEGPLTLHNAGSAAYGPLDLVNAIRVSSDTFFYNLGARTNVFNPFAQPQGGPLQAWARRFGIGRPTGVDIPGESSGTLPTPAFREGRNRLESECDGATGPFKGKRKHSPGGCGIADGTNRPWSIGDNINLAVGQGDVQATPLQLAVAYAALANGGTIVRPHVGLSIHNQAGSSLKNISPPPSRHLNINPRYLETIRQGLRDAASQPGGTSAAVFSNFPEQVYGKTGTAQYTGQNDYSWYACFVPASATTKPIVVVVHVEQGGFGAVAAAPVAREILSQWFFGKPGAYVAGSSKTL